MRTYILKRILGVVPTVLMITLVVFVMMRSVPGDPVVPLLGDAYTEEDAIKVREAYGLNKPVLVQYAIWLGKLVQGDWGTSILSGRPVLQDVLVRLPVTLELVVLSMGVALVIAIPAAIIGALRRNTWADYTATSVAMIGVSIPEFFTGVLLLLFFSVGLGGLLPSSGWVYLPGTCPMMVCGVSLWGNLQHVLMPAIALGIGRAALLTRLLRTSMLEVIRTEYVTTARAKGLAERPVVLKHALKNALIPTVTVMGLQVGFLIGGAAGPGGAPVPAQHARARGRGHRGRPRPGRALRGCARAAQSDRQRPDPHLRAAELGLPARNGPARARHAEPGHSRFSDLARRGRVVGAAGALRRGAVRDDRRLLRGSRRCGGDEGDGPDPRVPDLPARHHPDGHLHADGRADRHDEGDCRDRHRAHPDLCPSGPRQRALDQGEGVHRGVSRPRRARPPHPRAPRPAQLSGTDHRDHHPRYRDLHHRRGHAVLPRAGDAAADAELGVGSEGQRRVHPGHALAVALSRPRHLRHRAVLHPLRRRPARRARSSAQVAPAARAPSSARRREAASVASSAGKNDSTRSSWSVMSCGVPSVVSVVK